jgi:formamidopyrimidine-DNA glycosylase
MPELPEVETTCRGITLSLLNQCVKNVIIRQPSLRWPIPQNLKQQLQNHTITKISRRAKYILINTTQGTLICHLGMSGCLKVVPVGTPTIKHDHVDVVFNQHILRFNDPRRFGCILYTEDPIDQHPLFQHLGPEPLSETFNVNDLFSRAKKSQSHIKSFLMNQKTVVGVGNIYASEALFLAGIHPKRKANRISYGRLKTLVQAIKEVLQLAISQGGTTLKDYYASDGKPGYFSQQLKVYGRSEEPCHNCNRLIKKIILNQRSSFYCTHCQT